MNDSRDRNGHVTDTPDYAAAQAVDFSEIPVIDLTGIEKEGERERIAAELVDTASRILNAAKTGPSISREYCAAIADADMQCAKTGVRGFLGPNGSIEFTPVRVHAFVCADHSSIQSHTNGSQSSTCIYIQMSGQRSQTLPLHWQDDHARGDWARAKRLALSRFAPPVRFVPVDVDE